jgi:hypothetical protein
LISPATMICALLDVIAAHRAASQFPAGISRDRPRCTSIWGLTPGTPRGHRCERGNGEAGTRDMLRQKLRLMHGSMWSLGRTSIVATLRHKSVPHRRAITPGSVKQLQLSRRHASSNKSVAVNLRLRSTTSWISAAEPLDRKFRFESKQCAHSGTCLLFLSCQN